MHEKLSQEKQIFERNHGSAMSVSLESGSNRIELMDFVPHDSCVKIIYWLVKSAFLGPLWRGKTYKTRKDKT